MIYIAGILSSAGDAFAVAGQSRGEAESWYRFTLSATGLRPLYRVVVRLKARRLPESRRVETPDGSGWMQ